MSASSILFGSVLGFAAAASSGVVIGEIGRRSRANSLKVQIRLQLGDISKCFDDIRNAYDRQFYYDRLLLNILDKNIDNLVSTRKRLYLIREERTQQSLYWIMNKLMLLTADMRGTQAYSVNRIEVKDPQTGERRQRTDEEQTIFDNFILQRRQAQFIEMASIQRTITDVFSEISKVTRLSLRR